MRFKGSMVALVTPFRGNEVDYGTLGRLVDVQIKAGTDVLVPCGTTGESPTLSHEEHDKVIEEVVRLAAGKVPVMAGTGSNSTAEALRLTNHARQTGATGALLVSPYYNKPTPEGLYRHFATIAEASDFPLVLYNIPARCGVEIPVATIARLHRDYPQIVGVKHATGSIEGASELAMACDIDILSGDDSMTLPLMSIGGCGVISVLANIIPKDIKALTDSALSGDWEAARQWHRKTFVLAKGMLSIEVNPIPIKTAMAMVGMLEESFRLPLCSMTPEHRQELEREIQAYGLH